MVSQLQSPNQAEVIYPESDGQPMADNTKVQESAIRGSRCEGGYSIRVYRLETLAITGFWVA